MTAAEWAIVIATSAMTGVLVYALGMWGVRRRQLARIWGQP